MISAARTRAEKRFATMEKHQKRALSEQEEIAQAISEKTASLKALRLAKEINDRAEKLAK